MGHLRGAALLVAMTFAGTSGVQAIGLEAGSVVGGQTGFVDVAAAGKVTLRGLTGAALRLTESARLAEQMRQSFRGGPESNLVDPDLGSRSLPLGAKRLLELRTNLPQRHLSASKLASIGGMWANPGNPHKALDLAAGTVVSELGLRFIARPLGQNMRLSPWSNKHGTGLSAAVAF